MGGWTYMLRCSDKSFYVGSTSYEDVEMRVMEHNDGRYVGYTSRRRPVALAWAKWFDDLRDAHSTERRLKGWSRAKKEALIAGDESKLLLLSRRRAGRSPLESLRPKLTKRELADYSQSTGARHPEVRAKRAPKDE